MLKIMITCDGVTSTVEDKDACTVSDALQLFGQALKGCGFVFEGELDIVNEEDEQDEIP